MKLELIKHAGRIAGYKLVPENPAEESALKAIADGYGKAEVYPDGVSAYGYAGSSESNSIEFIRQGFEKYDIKTLTKLGDITITEVVEEPAVYLVCSECGSKNVQLRAWVDANTNRYAGETDDEEAWCEDCQKSVGLELVKRKTKKGKKNG
jgi:hypothetical protein